VLVFAVQTKRIAVELDITLRSKHGSYAPSALQRGRTRITRGKILETVTPSGSQRRNTHRRAQNALFQDWSSAAQRPKALAATFAQAKPATAQAEPATQAVKESAKGKHPQATAAAPGSARASAALPRLAQALPQANEALIIRTAS
jgi:hypothetical protein